MSQSTWGLCHLRFPCRENPLLVTYYEIPFWLSFLSLISKRQISVLRWVKRVCVWERSLVRFLQVVFLWSLRNKSEEMKGCCFVFTSYLLPGTDGGDPFLLATLSLYNLSKAGNRILWAHIGIWWKRDQELKGWVNVSLLFKYHYYLRFVGIWFLSGSWGPAFDGVVSIYNRLALLWIN